MQIINKNNDRDGTLYQNKCDSNKHHADYKENRTQIRMNYNSKPTENFLKIDYAKVEGGRCNRKFNYLSESNQ